MLGLPLLAACTPGISVNVHNVTAETLVVVQSFADSEASHRILSGEEKTVGAAVAWSVGAANGAWRVELQHPGVAFESATLFATTSEAYRFQVGPGRCVHALGPDQSPPIDRFVPQPEGYPLGPECPAR